MVDWRWNGRLSGPILLDRGLLPADIEVRSLPGPQERGTGGTLGGVFWGRRDLGRAPEDL